MAPSFMCDLCHVGLDSKRQASKHFDKEHGGAGRISLWIPKDQRRLFKLQGILNVTTGNYEFPLCPKEFQLFTSALAFQPRLTKRMTKTSRKPAGRLQDISLGSPAQVPTLRVKANETEAVTKKIPVCLQDHDYLKAPSPISNVKPPESKDNYQSTQNKNKQRKKGLKSLTSNQRQLILAAKLNVTVFLRGDRVIYKCRRCAKEFLGSSSHTRHYINVHMRIRFKCDFCNQTFSCQTYLRKHIRKICKYRPGTLAVTTTSQTTQALKGKKVKKRKEKEPEIDIGPVKVERPIPEAISGFGDSDLFIRENLKDLSESKETIHCDLSSQLKVENEDFRHGPMTELSSETVECDICHVEVQDLSTHVYTVHYEPNN